MIFKIKILVLVFLALSSFLFLPVFGQSAGDKSIGTEDTVTELYENNETDIEIEENQSEDLKQEVLKGYVSKVPGGTKLPIIVETPIDESVSKIDDEFTARTAEDIVIDNKVIIPIGSTVNGKITEINLAKRLHKAGSVRIEFKNLTTPDGRQIPIVASVLSRSGLLKGKYNSKRALIAGATVAAPIAAGFGAGLAAEGSPLGGTIGAALGLVAGIALFAFQRGNMVDIKAGEEFNIELTEDMLVPSKETTRALEEKEDFDPNDNIIEKDFSGDLDDSLIQEEEIKKE